MDRSSLGTVTRLLEAVRAGNRTALNDLFPLVYKELHALAHRQRRRWQGNYTVNTTALVHEVYLKLVDQHSIDWESRAHFFGVAAQAMRQILIDYVRQQRAQKRGGDAPKVSLDELQDMFGGVLTLTDERSEALLALDEALEKLGQMSERQSRIVECRFFGGMTIEETAAVLGLSTATVKRSWSLAQVWLYQEMQKALGA